MKIVLSLLLFSAFLGASSARAQPLRPEDVLTWQDGQFHLDGKPFAEISFNKFDLLWSIHTAEKTHDPAALQKAIARQESALRDLHGLGFRTLRIFGAPWGKLTPVWSDPAARQQLFDAIDTTLDLCERNQIQVIFSLGLGGFSEQADVTKPSPLYADPDSPARQLCYDYLDAVVNRYKGRKGIAMWEVSNELTNLADIGMHEGKAHPTLPQIAAFFDATAKRIKQDDPLRLVSTGGSTLRPAAWHRWHQQSWTSDTPAQYREAYAGYFADSAIDVVDTHYYGELKEGGLKLAPAPDGKETRLTLADQIQMIRTLGKAPILGEFGTLPSGWEGGKKEADPAWFEGYRDANAVPWVKMALDTVVDAGVPLAYWWAYQSDRPVDQRPDPVVLSQETTPELVQLVADASRRLKARLGAP